MEFNMGKLQELSDSFPIGECLFSNTIEFDYVGTTNSVDLCMFAAHLEQILCPLRGHLNIICRHLGGYHYEVKIEPIKK